MPSGIMDKEDALNPNVAGGPVGPHTRGLLGDISPDWAQRIGLLGDALIGFGTGNARGGLAEGFAGANAAMNAAQKFRLDKKRAAQQEAMQSQLMNMRQQQMEQNQQQREAMEAAISQLPPHMQRMARAFPAQFARNAFGGQAQSPAVLQEWAAFQKMTPEQKAQFLTMKRANPYLNLGDRMAQMNPAQPGQVQASVGKGVSPDNLPENAAAKAAAVAGAQEAAKNAGAMTKRAAQAQQAASLLGPEVDALIDESTGSGIGNLVDAGAALFGESTPGAIAAGKLKVLQANLMQNMPRMEGPQSDKDVELYRQAAASIGDPTVPADIKKAAVQQIRDLAARYGQMDSRGNPMAPGTVEAGVTLPPKAQGISPEAIRAEIERRRGLK